MRIRALRSVINLVAEFGENAFVPLQDVNGRWLSPLVSRQEKAQLRKYAMTHGLMGSFSRRRGGWLPEWDTARKVALIRPHKGHKRERTRADRAAAIDRKLEEMPALLEQHREEMKALRPPRGSFVHMIKRMRDWKVFSKKQRKIAGRAMMSGGGHGGPR